MTKSTLHLTVETDLIELAKASGLNLSKEFEEWIRIRMNQFQKEEPIIDIDLEVAKHHAEITKLQSQKELNKKQSMQEEEEMMIVDDSIDNEIKFAKDEKSMDWNIIADQRATGIQFLFNKKFSKSLNTLEAKDMIMKRLKERKLID